MLRKLTLGIWLLALIGGSGWLLWRNQELRELHRSNAILREEVAAQKSGQAPEAMRDDTDMGRDVSESSSAGAAGTTQATHAAWQTNLASSTPALTLTPGERNELLTLRGKVAQLRRDVAAATRQSEQKSQPTTQASSTNWPPPGLEASIYRPSQDYGPALTTAAAEINHLLITHAEHHGGQVPASFPADAAARLGAEAAELAGRLELLPGETITPETDCCIFIAREREARQTADGEWVRLYLLASGGFIVAGPMENPDWERWERQQLGRMRESLRRRMQPSTGTTPAP